MTTTYEVTAVEKQTQPYGFDWHIITKRSDGERFIFVCHSYLFAARAAEYGIDLGDVETLMDVRFMQTFNDIDETHPDFVYHNSEEHARKALLARVAAAKQEHQILDPKNLLQQVKDHHKKLPHSDFHADHKRRVGAKRKAMGV